MSVSDGTPASGGSANGAACLSPARCCCRVSRTRATPSTRAGVATLGQGGKRGRLLDEAPRVGPAVAVGIAAHGAGQQALPGVLAAHAAVVVLRRRRALAVEQRVARAHEHVEPAARQHVRVEISR